MSGFIVMDEAGNEYDVPDEYGNPSKVAVSQVEAEKYRDFLQKRNDKDVQINFPGVKKRIYRIEPEPVIVVRWRP
jgi:hypothetical protein